MKVIAIDPGYSALGYAVGEKPNKLVEYGTLYFREKDRLREIYNKVCELFRRHNPHVALIEDYRIYEENRGKHKPAFALGVIVAVCYEFECNIRLVFHNSWKAEFERVYFTVAGRLSEEWHKALQGGSEHSRDAVMMLLPQVVDLKAILTRR